MQNEINPYAPPPLVAEVIAPPKFAPVDGGLWHDGRLLVILKGTPLPPRCIKSNQPTDKSLKRNLVWYPPWIAVTVLFAWPIFLVLVLALQKKATIHVGLSDEWMARRRTRVAIVWGLALLGVATFAGGIAMLDHIEYAGGFMMLASLLILIGALIYGTTAARLVTATKIDDRFVYLKGACAAYLGELPEWPGTR